MHKIYYNFNKTEKGNTLAFVLVMVIIVAITLTSLLTYVVSQLNYSKDRVERERAFQIAEAGAYYYRWYLAHQISGQTAGYIENFWKNGNPIGVGAPYIAEFKDPEGDPIGEYKLEVQPPTAGQTIVIVKSTGWTYAKPSAKRTVQVRFRRPSWSEYTFLSSSFLNFGNQSTVYGKVHSNEGVRFDGKAYNTVSSAKSSFDDSTYGGNRMEFGVHTTVNPADNAAPAYPWPVDTVPVRSDIFVGGREFPVAEVSFMGVTTDLSDMKIKAQDGTGKYFNELGLGRRINFRNDGTYDVCTVKTANDNSHAITRYWKNDMSGWCNTCNGACLSNYPIVDNGVIFVENNAWVEGDINGKRITLVAADLLGGGNQADIYIGISNKNLRYAAYDCNNMLGLVAQKDVVVLNDSPDDFIVDAALLAQTGFVGIIGGMGGKSSLTFNGAISSYLQTYFQNGNSGFADRTYNFNNNLLYCPPPYFPTGTEYSIDQWDEL
jgi:type II secretory pathway pseudopilin PulG